MSQIIANIGSLLLIGWAVYKTIKSYSSGYYDNTELQSGEQRFTFKIKIHNEMPFNPKEGSVNSTKVSKGTMTDTPGSMGASPDTTIVGTSSTQNTPFTEIKAILTENPKFKLSDISFDYETYSSLFLDSFVDPIDFYRILSGIVLFFVFSLNLSAKRGSLRGW